MRIVFVLLLTTLSFHLLAQDSAIVKSKEIIYGRKDGMALTMFMQSPPGKGNGHAIISIVSGNWRSSYELMGRFAAKDKMYVSSGYVIFDVIHGSQPRYTIPDEVEDIKRAVRYVRYHAAEFGIDPNKIGITGASSGGNLSLLVALADDKIDENSFDPVDKVSSRVQAAAVFFPPTDFLNYGQEGFNPAMSQAMLRATGLAAAFDFKRWNDTTRTYVSITDIEAKKNIAQQVSPAYLATADDPPVLIIHGDADRLVPLQQSQKMISKLEKAKVTTKLIVKPGVGHGWRNSEEDEKNFVDWFNKYLK